MSLLDLPVELVFDIATFLSPFNVLRLSHTSKQLRFLLTTDIEKLKQVMRKVSYPPQNPVEPASFGKWIHRGPNPIRTVVNIMRFSNDNFCLRQEDTQRVIKNTSFSYHEKQWIFEYFSSHCTAVRYVPSLADWKSFLSALDGPTGTIHTIFPLLVISRPSVLDLMLSWNSGCLEVLASMIRRSIHGQTSHIYPELRYLVIKLPIYEIGPEHNLFVDAQLILEYFSTCERLVKFGGPMQQSSRLGVKICLRGSVTTTRVRWNVSSTDRFPQFNADSLRPVLKKYGTASEWNIYTDDYRLLPSLLPIFRDNPRLSHIDVEKTSTSRPYHPKGTVRVMRQDSYHTKHSEAQLRADFGLPE